jgi:hypothetical protein
MWSHYARGHLGFVVEFDPQHPLFPALQFGQVDYSPTRPFIEERDYQKILLTKSPEWGYEAEYRLIKPVAELKSGRRRDKKEGHFIDLPLSAVKAVYFGCRMEPEPRVEILDSLSDDSAKHIDRFIMQRSAANFELRPIPWAEWKPLPPSAADILDKLSKAVKC